MRVRLVICLVTFFFMSCHKGGSTVSDDPGPSKGQTAALPSCDIEQVYADNKQKVTITNGVWGTVSNVEGNCMPTVPTCSTCCRNCPVKRTVRIYAYTKSSDAVKSDQSVTFFDSFRTALVAEVNTDDNGFFQADIPAGHYTMVVVENGKLYASNGDGQGGINPFDLAGGVKNVNFTITYKATF